MSVYACVFTIVQTFLSAHELSVCLHSSVAVLNKCRRKSSVNVDEYSLIYGAFYQLLNSMLVHRAESVFHLVPVFMTALQRILVTSISALRFFLCSVFFSSFQLSMFSSVFVFPSPVSYLSRNRLFLDFHFLLL